MEKNLLSHRIVHLLKMTGGQAERRTQCRVSIFCNHMMTVHQLKGRNFSTNELDTSLILNKEKTETPRVTCSPKIMNFLGDCHLSIDKKERENKIYQDSIQSVSFETVDISEKKIDQDSIQSVPFETVDISETFSRHKENSPRFCRDKSILLVSRVRQKYILKSLMHKMYLKLKEKQLLHHQNHQSKIAQPAFKDRQEMLSSQEVKEREKTDKRLFNTLSYSEKGSSQEEIAFNNERQLQKRACNEDNLSLKDTFHHRMHLKYQFPSPEEVQELSFHFPDPEKLFRQVVKPICEANAKCTPQFKIVSHLQNYYWKAHLSLPWPCIIKVTAMHQEKDKAVKGAFWLMCENLKNFGLISQNEDGSWVPMTCDKVVTMLETLSKYGESSFGSSKGRGFKIILEQSKDRGDSNAELKAMQADCSRSMENSPASDDTLSEVCSDKKKEALKQKTAVEKWHEANSQCRTGHAFSPANADANLKLQSPSSGSQYDLCRSHLELVSKRREKPKWLCIVHVGWPYRFTAQAEGLSLPSAQMMGYMTVVHKLKIRRLLTPCNNTVSTNFIEGYIFCHTVRHWLDNSLLQLDSRLLEKFNADAKIFSDASRKGFGAYLQLKEIEKVNWISENWDKYEMTTDALLIQNKLSTGSTIAELFAVVSAVFSWKHKLRGRRLLCFSDNSSVTGVINSFNLEHLRPEYCISALDHLICTLQSTCRQYNIKIHAVWHDRQQNWLADLLSRDSINAFQAAMPKAASKKTAAKKIKIVHLKME